MAAGASTPFPPPPPDGVLSPGSSASNLFSFDLAVVVCTILCGLRVLSRHAATLSQMWRM